MKKKILLFGLTLFLASTLKINAQSAKDDGNYRKWFVGSSMFMLGNLDKTNNPKYIQNINFHISQNLLVIFLF